MFRAEEYQITKKEIGGQPVSIISYRIGERYYCHVDNVDPGATIARGESGTSDDAIAIAVKKAEERLVGRVR